MDSATAVLMQYGIAGVAIIAEAFVIMKLYADIQQLHKDKDGLQEARRLDAKNTLDHIEEPLLSLARSSEFIADKLIQAKPRRD